MDDLFSDLFPVWGLPSSALFGSWPSAKAVAVLCWSLYGLWAAFCSVLWWFSFGSWPALRFRNYFWLVLRLQFC